MDKRAIAELCGIILGDGHVHISANRIVITGSLEDEPYHRHHVAKLFTRNFGVKPIFFTQEKKNAHYIQVESKICIGYFLGLGLKRGAKKEISMPEFISSKHLATCFLRGLFDTDGWLKFSKMRDSKKPYPRIRLTAKKSKLALQIGVLLSSLGFNYSIWQDQRTANAILNYEISGKENTERWFRTIQPKNPKHLKRYNTWQKIG